MAFSKVRRHFPEDPIDLAPNTLFCPLGILKSAVESRILVSLPAAYV